MTLPPRLDPDEITYFEQFMANKKPFSTMVEWGSGGSTMMFLPHFETGKFISIEHNEEWYKKVKEAVYDGNEIPAAAKKNFEYLYRPPMIDIRFYGYGVPFEENPAFADAYINPEPYDSQIWDADIYFVDGICRGPILANLFRAARNRDATVFIHDFYGAEERWPWYKWAVRFYSSIEQIGSTLARLRL